jgi:hypothetical protein
VTEETATNPVEVETSPDVEVETETQEVEQQELDDEGNPVEQTIEDEEIDLDDLKLKVTKDQAQKVREALLRQADYTKKTQELSDQRKAFDQERQSYQQASQEELGVAAHATSLGQQLSAYARMTEADWQQWQYDDPDAAQSGFRQYQLLKDQHGQALGQLNHLRTQRVSAAQQEAAKRIEQTKAALTKDIPGWNDALEAQVADFGVQTFGFTRDEMADMKIDPRIAKAFHRLHTLEQAEAKRSKAQGHVAAQAVKPAAKAGGGSSAPPAGLDDRLSVEEWTRRREAQVRKRA